MRNWHCRKHHTTTLFAQLLAAALVVGLTLTASAAPSARPPTRVSRSSLGFYHTHGNAKWGKDTLRVSQAREAIARAVAGKLNANHYGLRVNPRDINVTVKLARDGKTAVWRAEPVVGASSPFQAMIDKGLAVRPQEWGTIDVSLRDVTDAAVQRRAYELSQWRNSGNAARDWREAEAELSRFGNKPHEATIRRRASEIYRKRVTGSALSDYHQALRELRLDLDNRVTFIKSSKAYNRALESLLPKKVQP